MPENESEILFPTIRFPIVTDLRMNALALAAQYGMPPPDTLRDVASIVLANMLVLLFRSDRIGGRPCGDEESEADAKGACFLYIIGAAVCRVLAEQGNEIDAGEVYGASSGAIFQGCPEERAAAVLRDGQAMAERLFDEALENREVNEFVQYVMSLGLLYAIEPKEGTLAELASLFERFLAI
ncbi:MAG TPA: hypothetical protein VIU29_00720 [Candidatus Deferrimicrobiaceae bacterium]